MDHPATSFQQPAYSETAQKFLARKPMLFINNEWIEAQGPTLPVEDPSTGRFIAEIADATDAEVDRAVAAARTAFDDGRWSDLPPIQRERTIHRLADLIEKYADEFAELEAIDKEVAAQIAESVDFAKAAPLPTAADGARRAALVRAPWRPPSPSTAIRPAAG